MKVLFIYPNLYAQVGFNYGVASLSSVLNAHGHETKLLNINEKLGYPLDLSRIKKDVLNFKPDLIAFSFVTNHYKYAKIIANSVREYSSIPIIVGGIHSTIAPEEVLLNGAFDFVCVGEGEYALLELVERLAKGKDPKQVRNIWFRGEDGIVKNPLRPLVSLEGTPRKDYEIFDFQRMIEAKDGWVGIMTSRGCPFKCTYCFNHQIISLYKREMEDSPPKNLNYIRYHPIEDVIEEIVYLLSSYNHIKMFIFDDDIFTLNRQYLMEFCKEYRKLTFLPFVVNAHVKAFDREIAHELARAGCRIVKFGLESGSSRIRRNILNRSMEDEEIVRAFEIAHEAGLHTSAFLMIGLPYEEKEDLAKTVKLLAKIKPGRFRWSCFFPYYGTIAYSISVEGNFIDKGKYESLSNFTVASCLNFGPEQNLLIEKLAKFYHWYVNAQSDLPSSPYYKLLVEGLNRMDKEQWDKTKKLMQEIDRNLTEFLETLGIEHYSMRFNEFTGIRSSYKD